MGGNQSADEPEERPTRARSATPTREPALRVSVDEARAPRPDLYAPALRRAGPVTDARVVEAGAYALQAVARWGQEWAREVREQRAKDRLAEALADAQDAHAAFRDWARGDPCPTDDCRELRRALREGTDGAAIGALAPWTDPDHSYERAADAALRAVAALLWDETDDRPWVAARDALLAAHRD
jgi:hypothetical protein